MSTYNTYLTAVHEQLGLFKRQQFARGILPVVQKVKRAYQETQQTIEKYKAIESELSQLVEDYQRDIKRFGGINDTIQDIYINLLTLESKIQSKQELSEKRPDVHFLKSDIENIIFRSQNYMGITEIEDYINEVDEITTKLANYDKEIREREEEAERLRRERWAREQEEEAERRKIAAERNKKIAKGVLIAIGIGLVLWLIFGVIIPFIAENRETILTIIIIIVVIVIVGAIIVKSKK
jgi:DNA repair exonuclease SbcCD ATPase subunit